jgi:2,3-bisphosphoglycerate-dependent phosphoglycerate mutase
MLTDNKPSLRDLLACAKQDYPLTLDIVRHGATALNGENNASVDSERGWSDVPLTEDGRRQALEAGLALKGRRINAIVSSDLNRAQETAEIIGEVLNIRPRFSARLRPWGLGTFTNRPMSEVTPQIEAYARNRPDTPVPEGESFNQFRLRAFDGLASAVAKNPGKIVIVAHHRIERLIAAWRANGQPIEHTIDIPTFLKQGDPPGGVIELNTHKQLLAGEIDEKLTHYMADYGPGHGNEFCKTCRFSDHQSPPHCSWVSNIEKRGYCHLWKPAGS